MTVAVRHDRNRATPRDVPALVRGSGEEPQAIGS
jgi:hypothetical protein